MIQPKKPSKLNSVVLALSASRDARKKSKSDVEGIEHHDTDFILEISELLTKRYRGISLYGAVMFLISVAIIWTSVLVSNQVQAYHQGYMVLQEMKEEERKLQIEHQRLVIEQQTFSATPQIASRAVIELGMYSPSIDDKLILQPAATPDPALKAEPRDTKSGLIQQEVSND